MQKSKRLAMAALLEDARTPQYQLWAENAPIDFKDLLKSRGYRWSPDRRCWSLLLEEGRAPRGRGVSNAKSMAAGRLYCDGTSSPRGTGFLSPALHEFRSRPVTDIPG